MLIFNVNYIDGKCYIWYYNVELKKNQLGGYKNEKIRYNNI